jgi:nitrogenase subunit NifH
MLHDSHKSERGNKAEQFLQESAAWLRLLDFFKQENSYLKTRLSVVLDNKTDREFLNHAEHYQNLFILKDEFINEIAKDAKMHEDKLKQVSQMKKMPDDKQVKQHQKLRNEVEHLEKEFIRMKHDFNKALIAAL